MKKFRFIAIMLTLSLSITPICAFADTEIELDNMPIESFETDNTGNALPEDTFTAEQAVTEQDDSYPDAELSATDINDFIFASNDTGVTVISYIGNEKYVTIPDSVDGVNVTAIGASAFNSDTHPNTLYMEGIYIPDTVTEIGKNAFFGCLNLRSNIDNNKLVINAKIIGDNAFYDCTKISELEINNAESVGTKAFYNCTILTSITVNGNNTVFGDYAFSGDDTFAQNTLCAPILKGTLSFNGISTLGKNIFAGTGIEKINFPEINAIPAGAFSSCTALREVNIPDCVTTIDNGTSYKTSAFPNVTDGAFSGCTSLESIDLNNITTLGAYAFSNSGLYMLEIPNGVETIPVGLCTNASALAIISIPDTVTAISDGKSSTGAFLGCSSLIQISFSKNLNTIGAYSFAKCSSLSSISIPASVSVISDYTFDSCTSLSRIAFASPSDSQLNSINQYAFNKCTAINSITLPDNIQTLGTSAFNGCTGMMSITMPKSLTTAGASLFSSCTLLKSCDISNTQLTSISANMFNGCCDLAEIGTLPETVTQIEKRAFYNSGLEKITVPDTISSIGVEAFRKTSSLENIDLTGTQTLVFENGAFADSGLSSIDLCNRVRSLPTQCFMNCTELKTIIPGTKLKTIEDGTNKNGVFYNCTSLTGMDYSSLISIGSYAFQNSGITNITFPSQMDTIPDGVCDGCTQLESVTIPNTIYTIGGKVTCPEKTGVVSISSSYGAFSRCSSLKKIYLPDSITAVNGAAFALSGLEEIRLSDNIPYISEGVFYGCDKLVSVHLPKRLLSLKDGVFQKCTSLEQIEIPDSVVAVGRYAFAGCSRMKYAMIGSVANSKISTMGDYAFKDCTNLDYLIFTGTLPVINSDIGTKNIDILYINSSNPSPSEYWLKNFSLDAIEDQFDYELKDNYAVIAKYKGDLPVAFVPPIISQDGINYSVTGCNDNAFESVQTIALPGSITALNPFIFANDKALQKVVVSCFNNNFAADDYGVYSNDYSTLIYCMPQTDYNMPSSVTSIIPAAFIHHSLNTIKPNNNFIMDNGALLTADKSELITFEKNNPFSYNYYLNPNTNVIYDYAAEGKDGTIYIMSDTAPTIADNSIDDTTPIYYSSAASGFSDDAWKNKNLIEQNLPDIKYEDNTVTYNNDTSGKCIVAAFKKDSSGNDVLTEAYNADIVNNTASFEPMTFTPSRIKIMTWESLDNMNTVYNTITIQN